MKRAKLIFYDCLNLGDDIFVDIVAKRYPNVEFLVDNRLFCEKVFPSNVKGMKITVIHRLIRKILNKIKPYTFERLFGPKKLDLVLQIGGSMYIEKSCDLEFWKQKLAYYHSNSKIPYYILGSNVGPYETGEYIELLEQDEFSKATDVCFREKNTYDIFKELPNIRVEPDIVLSLDVSNIKITEKDKVVISVINSVPESLKDKYMQTIIDFIEFFHNMKYEILLMSFCKSEGDEIAVDIIEEKVKGKVSKYYYRGNIQEALNMIADCKIVIGSRFHANILGLVLNKTIIPMAYSDKTINTLRDLDFKGEIIDIRNINNFNKEIINKIDINYKLNISAYKEKAENQFLKLDEFLKGE